MVVKTAASPHQMFIEVVGENEHENTLLTLISQKAFSHVEVSESAGTCEPTKVHMRFIHRNPDLSLAKGAYTICVNGLKIQKV
jgi:hypothetical protein